MAAVLYNSTGMSAQWPGAIVGQLPNPSGCLSLAAGQYMTTGDVQNGEGGEMGGLAVFSIGFWFHSPTSVTGVTENIMHGPMTTTGTTSRQWRFAINTTGTVTFAARNSTPSEITATSTSALLPDTWYYIGGEVSTTTIKIFINGVEAGSTAWSGTVQAEGATAGSKDTVIGDAASTKTRLFDEIAIFRYAAHGQDGRFLAHYVAGSQRGFPNGQTTADRYAAILNAVNSYAPRNIEASSQTTMSPSFWAGQSALDALEEARAAENVDATIFTSKSGAVTFLSHRYRVVSPWVTVQMTLGDQGGTEVAYEDVGMEYADEVLVNEWTVTRTGGPSQVRSDATSIARYGRRPQSLTGLSLTPDAAGDSQALTIAGLMLDKYKDPILRGTTVALDCGDPVVADQVFDRDLADRVELKRTPPGGGSRIDQQLFIQQISISGANDGRPWAVSWGISPI